MFDKLAVIMTLYSALSVGTAPGLDSSSYKVREKTQTIIQKMPILFSAGGVLSLTHHPSPEVQARAWRCVGEWESLCDKWLVQDTSWMDEYLNIPTGHKPWRKLYAIEQEHSSRWTKLNAKEWSKKLKTKFPKARSIVDSISMDDEEWRVGFPFGFFATDLYYAHLSQAGDYSIKW